MFVLYLNSLNFYSDSVKVLSRGANFDRPENLPFARKGVIGDWKNKLSERQSKIIDNKLKNTAVKYPGFDKLWDGFDQYLL